MDGAGIEERGEGQGEWRAGHARAASERCAPSPQKTDVVHGVSPAYPGGEETKHRAQAFARRKPQGKATGSPPSPSPPLPPHRQPNAHRGHGEPAQ